MPRALAAGIEDLTPFFADRCWMFVYLARQAHVGVILRRGPTEWWRVTLWDTRSDSFESGQWFRGRLYPEKCDLSPDGKLFVYFGGKFNRRSEAGGYKDTWTAVSRPPYLTALALWPIGGTWGGSGIFLDNNAVLLGSSDPDWPKHHPNHPPGPLQVLTHGDLSKDDARHNAVPGWLSGWNKAEKYQDSMGRDLVGKRSGDLVLARYAPLHLSPSRQPTLYSIYTADGRAAALFEAHWADWDQQGRLVATAGGRVLAGELTQENKLRWGQLASMHNDRPAPIVAPAWARSW